MVDTLRLRDNSKLRRTQWETFFLDVGERPEHGRSRPVTGHCLTDSAEAGRNARRSGDPQGLDPKRGGPGLQAGSVEILADRPRTYARLPDPYPVIHVASPRLHDGNMAVWSIAGS